jgi:hypothetical protein
LIFRASCYSKKGNKFCSQYSPPPLGHGREVGTRFYGLTWKNRALRLQQLQNLPGPRNSLRSHGLKGDPTEEEF